MGESALFTGVAQEMGKGGAEGAPLRIFSCPPPDLGGWPLEGKAWGTPVSPLNLLPGGESQSLCPSGLGLWSPWLHHPFTDSSFLPQQLPRPAPSTPGSTAAQWFGSLQIP